MGTRLKMVKRMWHSFQTIRGIIEYFQHKEYTGLLLVTIIELIGDGIPRVVYEIHWGAYCEVVQPEFERLCDDHSITPETWYTAQGSDAWSKIARKDFAPDTFMKVQVLLHERRKG